LRDHADALRAFPELAKKFKDAGAAQEAVGEATAAHKAALDDSRNRPRLTGSALMIQWTR